MSRIRFVTGWLTLCVLGLGGCAAAPAKRDPEHAAAPPDAPAPDSPTELRQRIQQLNERIQSLEGRVSAVSDSMNAIPSAPPPPSRGKGAVTSVAPPAVDAVPGERPVAAARGNDPEAGFTRDEAVEAYRSARILLDAGKLSESVLAFAAFGERYPDHVLAGSAQYWVGAAYLRRKEYKLAAQELERSLTAYDRGPRVSDALRDLSVARRAQKDATEAEKARVALETHFPTSPAHAWLANAQPPTAPGAPQHDAVPEARQAAPAAARLDPLPEESSPHAAGGGFEDSGAIAPTAPLDAPPPTLDGVRE